MKAQLKISALLILASVLASGCVTHRFFINLTHTPSLRYMVEGDSSDVHDGVLALPEGAPWVKTSAEEDEGSDGSPTSRITWAVSPLTSVSNPVAASGSGAEITAKRQQSPIHERSSLRITFPSWEAKERYGDVEKYMPTELMDALEDPIFDSMHPGKREELQQKLVSAELRAARDRYDVMLQELVKAWYAEEGRNFDDETYAENTVRFFHAMRDIVLRERTQGGDTPNTDWYDELRTIMAEAAMGITGKPSAQMMLELDSLELRYKRYLDLNDDQIEVMAVMPGRWTASLAPDTVMHDTLVWQISGETYANETLVLEANSWQPRWPGLLLLLLVIQVIASLLLRQRSVHDLPAPDASLNDRP